MNAEEKSKRFHIALAAIVIIFLLFSLIGYRILQTTSPISQESLSHSMLEKTVQASGDSNIIRLVATDWLPTEMPEPMDWEAFATMYIAWMDTITEETDGRVVFDYYPSETLVTVSDTTDAIRQGVCDIGVVHPLTEPQKYPLTSALSLPGLFPRSSVISSSVVWRLSEEGYMDNEYAGMHRLYSTTNYPADIGCRTKPLQSLEDFQGLKVAVMGKPEADTIAAMGGTPVLLAITEQYVALKGSIVDAICLEFHGQVAYGFYELSPYLTAMSAGCRTLDWCMNQKTWDSLPEDIQEVFSRNSGLQQSIKSGNKFDENFANSVEYLSGYAEKNGHPPLYYPNEAEKERWMAMWEPVWEETIDELEADGLPAQVMIDRAIELRNRYMGKQLEGIVYPAW